MRSVDERMKFAAAVGEEAHSFGAYATESKSRKEQEASQFQLAVPQRASLMMGSVVIVVIVLMMVLVTKMTTRKLLMTAHHLRSSGRVLAKTFWRFPLINQNWNGEQKQKQNARLA